MAKYKLTVDSQVDGVYKRRGEVITVSDDYVPSKKWEALDSKAIKAYQKMESDAEARKKPNDTEVDKLKQELEEMKNILVQNSIIEKAKLLQTQEEAIEAKKAKAKADAETKAS